MIKEKEKEVSHFSKSKFTGTGDARESLGHATVTNPLSIGSFSPSNLLEIVKNEKMMQSSKSMDRNMRQL